MFLLQTKRKQSGDDILDLVHRMSNKKSETLGKRSRLFTSNVINYMISNMFLLSVLVHETFDVCDIFIIDDTSIVTTETSFVKQYNRRERCHTRRQSYDLDIKYVKIECNEPRIIYGSFIYIKNVTSF